MSTTAQARFGVEALAPKGNGKEAHSNEAGAHGNGQGQNGAPGVEARKAKGEWRDHKGRFLRGNEEGVGNPFAREVAEARAAFVGIGSPEAMRQLAEVLLERALEGSVAAAKLFLEYTLGRPAKAVDPDRLEVQEFEYFIETAGKYGWTAKNLIEPEAEFTLGILRGCRSGVKTDLAKMLSKGIKEIDAREKAAKSGIPPVANGEMRVVAPSPDGCGGGVGNKPKDAS